MEETIMLDSVGAGYPPEEYNDLIQALFGRDIKKFEDILEEKQNLDIDYCFRDPYYGTLLDIACENDSKVNGTHFFVEALLNKGANPNRVNSLKKKAPIHVAVQSGNLNTLEAFLNCSNSDFSVVDKAGDTPLHLAIRNVPLDELRLILSKNIDVNKVNRKGKSPLYIALESNNRDAALALLNHKDINVEAGNLLNTHLREILTEICPNWKSLTQNNKKINEYDLFNLLRCNQYDNFLRLIRSNTQYIDANDGSYTFLQYCCEFGLVNVVKELLQLNADPNVSHSMNELTPIMIASYKGYVEIVTLLVRTGKCNFEAVKGETVLHCVVKGASDHSGLGENDIEKDHLKCLSILLTVKNKININKGDLKRNTALHYAAKQGEHEMVLSLLKNGAYIGCCNILGEPACADISRDTFETFLNECITTNEKLPREDTYEILLNFTCLNPVGTEITNFDYEDTKKSTIYSSFECKPLLYITQNPELKHLLKHPLFTSFLHLKWHKIRKYFFFNLIFYSFFWIMFTAYILCIYSEIPSEPISQNGTLSNSYLNKENSFLWSILILFLAGLILRELLQFTISPLRYVLSPENWLEMLIIAVSIRMLFFQSTSITHQLSAIGIMCSWAEMVLLIGRHPALSTNIEMLKTVSVNFLKFLAWYSLLIVAFALSFYTLFKDSKEGEVNFFEDPGISIFKTVVMLTGEFDASSIPFIQQPGTSHILFVLFVFLIAIVLFNLLNGLAVSDTQAIKSNAELVGYISRVKLISYLETMVANPLPTNAILKCNIFSCFESNRLDNIKNKILSKKINIFQDMSNDYNIRIFPNVQNRVEMNSMKFALKRKQDDVDAKCYETCMTVAMDPSIVNSAMQILRQKQIEKVHEEIDKKRKENEIFLIETAKECHEYLKEFKKVMTENKETLEKIMATISMKGKS